MLAPILPSVNSVEAAVTASPVLSVPFSGCVNGVIGLITDIFGCKVRLPILPFSEELHSKEKVTQCVKDYFYASSRSQCWNIGKVNEKTIEKANGCTAMRVFL